MREVWGPHPGLFYELFLVVLGHLMNVCVAFLFFFFFFDCTWSELQHARPLVMACGI